MAIQKVEDWQEATHYAFESLKAEDLLGKPGRHMMLGLWEKVEPSNDSLGGRNRKAYYGYERYGQSAGGPFSESSPALASANAPEATSLEMSPVDMQRTIGLSWQARQNIEANNEDDAIKSAAKLLTGAVESERTRLATRLEGGRDDNVGARAHAAGTGTRFYCDKNVPLLFAKGDQVRAYKVPAGETNDERLRTQPDTGTAYLGSTVARVTNVVHEADTPYFDLSVGSTWNDDVVVCWSDNATIDGPYGLPNHLDQVTDTSFKHDADDGTSTDHLDIYLGATRSSDPDAECWTYNAETAELDLSHFQIGIARAVDRHNGDPSVTKTLMVGMNWRMWRRFCKSQLGAVRFMQQKLILPGGEMEVPVLDGKGVTPMPILLTWNIPDGRVYWVDYSKAKKLQTKMGWLSGHQGPWFVLPQATVAGYRAEWEAYMLYSVQTGLFMPRSSGIMYGFSVATKA